MKIKKIIIIFLILMFCTPTSLATQEEILETQSQTLNIKGFIDEANKYTQNIFDGMDTQNVLDEAIKGNINNKTIINSIINLFGKEIKETIKIIRKYISNNSNT